jgi:transcriptional regulator of arginine metabolism
MARASRQLKILEIISKYDIDTQEELVARLRDDGYSVTQATISRDIKDMNIIKTFTDDGRHYKYVAQQPKEPTTADKFIKIFRNTVLSIRSAENLIILKTEQGGASAAAELIDRLEYEEILGVIAGDNTIFVAVDSKDHVDAIVESLENILQ